MRKIPTLFLLLAIASCTSAQQTTKPSQPSAVGTAVTLTDADRAAVESAVRAQLGQPGATFRTMIAQRDASSALVVCGYVNPGAGDTPFVGMFNGGAFTVTDLGGTTERTIAVQKACHGRGIYI